MKLLTSVSTWRQWVRAEEGRFADSQHAPPKTYPCFAYMELASWGQESLRPIYLYAHDVDAMSIELLAAAQRM